MDESALRNVSQVGGLILEQSRPTKDFLIKSLRQAVNALSQIEPPLGLHNVQQQEASNVAQSALVSLRTAVIEHSLAKHRDKDVKLLVGIVVSEMFRIMAPEQPFDDKYLKDIFKLIVSIFKDLEDTSSPLFSKRVKILETIAQCKCCVIMLDIECHDLVYEMFNILFSVVRKNQQWSLLNGISSILTHIMNEEPNKKLRDVVLQNLLKEEKGEPSAASQLAASVIQAGSKKLQPLVCDFLLSCILKKDSRESELKVFYHDIILKLSTCSPHILLPVIPSLTHELLDDRVDVRMRAVRLFGKLFSVPEIHATENYPNVFKDFMRRFTDTSMEVRITALQGVKDFCMTNPTGSQLHEMISAMEGRLLDVDDKVRIQAVSAVCDLARVNLKLIPSTLIILTAERLRDKKVSVRKKALQQLLEVYRHYCTWCAGDSNSVMEHFEQIPCNILLLCNDQDCKEFRSQNMDVLLAEDLFPNVSPLEKAKHWTFMFSFFTPLHLKALNSVLHQKCRLQTELQNYLTLRRKNQDQLNANEKMNAVKGLFKKMSACFLEPAKAEDAYNMLDQLQDNFIFDGLATLLNEMSQSKSQSIRDGFVKEIRETDVNMDFMKVLCSKCSFSIFSLEYVHYIIDLLCTDQFQSTQFKLTSPKLLQVISCYWPSLLAGSEVKLCELLEHDAPYRDQIIEVLAKAGHHISIDPRDIYKILERICIDGSRRQSKAAVSALAALMSSSRKYLFSDLCKSLVVSLHKMMNLPTILQSLGCIGRYSPETFDDLDVEITPFIYEKILWMESLDSRPSSYDTVLCNDSSTLKIYGLKTVVNSFVGNARTLSRGNIKQLLEILLEMLQVRESALVLFSSSDDSAEIRAAAAKSVLRLSKRWDLHVSPELYRSTMFAAKDPSPFVRKKFVDKVYKLLKEHAIPHRYACAFVLATSDCLKDLQMNAFKYMAEFIRDYSRKAHTLSTPSTEGESVTQLPVYIVVFLIHILAHDPDFPPEDCQDEQTFALFVSPLLFLIRDLLNPTIFDNEMDLVRDTFSYLNIIFRAIRKAEDAVDKEKTVRLHILSEVGITFTNSLIRGSTHLRAPGMILLPSSTYKVATASPVIDREFVKAIVKQFLVNSSEAAWTRPKQGDAIVGRSEPTEQKRFKYVLCDKVNTLPRLTSGLLKEGTGDIILKCKRKPDASSADPADLPTRGLLALEQENSAGEQKLGKEQVNSSCGSVDNGASLTGLQSKKLKKDISTVTSKISSRAGNSSITIEPKARAGAKRGDLKAWIKGKN
ncbi:hypothetical protein MLD38_034022 [Melastoma candidum]|uniref:Uncharacterized protein n=1 Tax=Melastoma candidum TaxID=119954 RepID=A0ACB9M986_9MYRT|nr:hypothetical protein MLD38_034022 [Melastoma candidum]